MNEPFPVTRIVRPKCAECRDTGVWHYDENHGCPCPDCCTHPGGWWILGEFYSSTDERYAACRSPGCGTTISKAEYEGGRRSMNEHETLFSFHTRNCNRGRALCQ